MTITAAPIEFWGSPCSAPCKEQTEKLSCHLAYGQKGCKEGATAIRGFGEGYRLGYDAGRKYGLRVEKLGWKAGQDRQRQSVTMV
jgi:hypothetical protein